MESGLYGTENERRGQDNTCSRISEGSFSRVLAELIFDAMEKGRIFFVLANDVVGDLVEEGRHLNGVDANGNVQDVDVVPSSPHNVGVEDWLKVVFGVQFAQVENSSVLSGQANSKDGLAEHLLCEHVVKEGDSAGGIACVQFVRETYYSVERIGRERLWGEFFLYLPKVVCSHTKRVHTKIVVAQFREKSARTSSISDSLPTSLPACVTNRFAENALGSVSVKVFRRAFPASSRVASEGNESGRTLGIVQSPIPTALA